MVIAQKRPARLSGPQNSFFKTLEVQLQPEYGLPGIARETKAGILEVRCIRDQEIPLRARIRDRLALIRAAGHKLGMIECVQEASQQFQVNTLSSVDVRGKRDVPVIDWRRLNRIARGSWHCPKASNNILRISD